MNTVTMTAPPHVVRTPVSKHAARGVLGMIGNTPLVDVSNLSPNPNVRILAKMEMQNPFGSVKDRIAKIHDRGSRSRRAAATRSDHP